MMYGIAKLARRIAEELDVNRIKVWDILDELNYQTQELTDKEIAKWSLKVSRRLFNK